MSMIFLLLRFWTMKTRMFLKKTYQQESFKANFTLSFNPILDGGGALEKDHYHSSFHNILSSLRHIIVDPSFAYPE